MRGSRSGSGSAARGRRPRAGPRRLRGRTRTRRSCAARRRRPCQERSGNVLPVGWPSARMASRSSIRATTTSPTPMRGPSVSPQPTTTSSAASSTPGRRRREPQAGGHASDNWPPTNSRIRRSRGRGTCSTAIGTGQSVRDGYLGAAVGAPPEGLVWRAEAGCEPRKAQPSGGDRSAPRAVHHRPTASISAAGGQAPRVEPSEAEFLGDPDGSLVLVARHVGPLVPRTRGGLRSRDVGAVASILGTPRSPSDG